MRINKAFAQLALRDPKIMDNISREADRRSVYAMRALPTKQPRYEVAFSNGIWTIFDNLEYRNCEPDLRTHKAALELLHG